MTLELGVLVSGNGSNLQAILDAIAARTLDARVRVVVSNQPGAFAVERARQASVPSVVCSHKDYASRQAFDQRLIELLQEAGAEWIVLAGFMRILTPEFMQAFKGRVLNIHPALLPAFPGTHAIRQALAYGVKITGCTVHWVDSGVDSGPIVLQEAVPVLDNDTEESLGERIHRAEHALFVDALRKLSQGSIAPPGQA
jgi:phosphoribosylglycinamide formyltransferase-1